jgi:hypothetical protein
VISHWRIQIWKEQMGALLIPFARHTMRGTPLLPVAGEARKLPASPDSLSGSLGLRIGSESLSTSNNGLLVAEGT